MVQTTPLQQAQPGDSIAIAQLLNRALQPKGITAKVKLKEGCLQVLLEAEQALDPRALTGFVARGVSKLNLPSVHTLRVYGKQTGQTNPAWQQGLVLRQPEPVNAVLDGNSEIAVSGAECSTGATGQGAIGQGAIGQGAIADSTDSAPIHAATIGSVNDLDAMQQAVIQALGADVDVELTVEDSLLVITLTTSQVLEGQSAAKSIKEALDPLKPSFSEAKILKRNPRTLRSFPIKQISLGETPQAAPEPAQSHHNQSSTSAINSSSASAGQFVTAPSSRSTAKPYKSEMASATAVRKKLTVVLIIIAMAFVLYRLMRRLLIILAVSPAMGGFSIIMALVALWRAYAVFKPLLRSLLRGGE